MNLRVFKARLSARGNYVRPHLAGDATHSKPGGDRYRGDFRCFFEASRITRSISFRIGVP